MICFLEWPGPAQAARVYIDIDSPGFRRLPLAVYLISDPAWNNDASLDPDIPPNLYMVLIQDLEVCGHFQLLSSEVVLLEKKDEAWLWEIYEAVRDEIEAQLGDKGIHVNVGGVTGLIYHALGFPPDSFPIPLALALQVGWMAHCLEYLSEGRIIEPRAIYTG